MLQRLTLRQVALLCHHCAQLLETKMGRLRWGDEDGRPKSGLCLKSLSQIFVSGLCLWRCGGMRRGRCGGDRRFLGGASSTAWRLAWEGADHCAQLRGDFWRPSTSAWPPEIPPHFLCLCRQRPHRPRAGGEGGSLAGPYVAHLSSLSCFYRRIAPWRDPPVEAARGWTARVAAEPASPPAQGRWGRQSVPPARVGELRENFWRTSTRFCMLPVGLAPVRRGIWDVCGHTGTHRAHTGTHRGHTGTHRGHIRDVRGRSQGLRPSAGGRQAVGGALR